MAKKSLLIRPIGLVIAGFIIVIVFCSVILKHMLIFVWNLIEVIPITIKTLLHLMVILPGILLKVGFVLIKTLLQASLVLIFSPIWYPIFIITHQGKQKRFNKHYADLFVLITDYEVNTVIDVNNDNKLLSEYQPKKNNGGIFDSFSIDYDQLLMQQLVELIDVKDKWFISRIDWADVDEVESQLNALLVEQQIKEHFRPTTLNELVDSIPMVLCEFEYWLASRGYCLVLWDQGNDEYVNLICPTSSCADIVSLAEALKLAFVVDMAKKFNDSVDKSAVIEHLTFLINSAKARNIEQGVDTFSHFVRSLREEEESLEALYESLYSQVCGMSRFADYTDEEYEKVMSLICILQLYQAKTRSRVIK